MIRLKPAVGPVNHSQHAIGDDFGGTQIHERAIIIALLDYRDHRLIVIMVNLLHAARPLRAAVGDIFKIFADIDIEYGIVFCVGAHQLDNQAF